MEGAVIIERTEFFKLATTDQKGLRFVLAATSISHVAQFAITPNHGNLAFTLAGIAGNVAILFCSLFIAYAPVLFFRIIPWVFVLIFFFDSWSVCDPAPGESVWSVKNILSAFNVLLALFFSGALWRFWRAVRQAKNQVS